MAMSDEDVDYSTSTLSDEELDHQLAKLDRRRILTMLVDLIEKLHYKSLTGRIEHVDNERVRVSYARSFGYLVQVFASLSKDTDLDEMHSRLKDLEAVLDGKEV